MGQYYTAIVSSSPINGNTVSSCTQVQPHDYGDGSKLMEHSWIHNNFVNAICLLLSKGVNYLLWAGDYADSEEDDETNMHHIAHAEIVTVRLEEPEDIEDFVKVNRYLINHSRKEYVDMSKVPEGGDGWRIHPLPLLTCEGNGRGGGDYYGESGQDYVGLWARNLIVIRPDKPINYEEITPDFML